VVARPAEAPCCPKCNRPARRVGKPGDPLHRRVLETRAGPIELVREKWRCTACRVVFFPPRRSVGADSRGI
jgi:transposase